MKKYKLTDNVPAACYEFRIDGQVARIDYEKVDHGEILLTHTEVPYDLQGQGIGRALVEAALTDIEAQGLKVIPLCGFVLGYIQRHPEWMRIVPEGIEV